MDLEEDLRCGYSAEAHWALDHVVNEGWIGGPRLLVVVAVAVDEMQTRAIHADLDGVEVAVFFGTRGDVRERVEVEGACNKPRDLGLKIVGIVRGTTGSVGYVLRRPPQGA